MRPERASLSYALYAWIAALPAPWTACPNMADPSLRTLVGRLLPALHESAPCSIMPSGASTLLPVTTRTRTFLVVTPLCRTRSFLSFLLLFLCFPSFQKGLLTRAHLGLVLGQSSHPALAHLGGLGVRDPRPGIGIVICLFCFICSCYGARPILAVTTCVCPTLGARRGPTKHLPCLLYLLLLWHAVCPRS